MNIEFEANGLGNWIIVRDADGKQALTGKLVTKWNWEGYVFFGYDGAENFSTDIDVALAAINGKSIEEVTRILEKEIRDSEFSYIVFGGKPDPDDKAEYDFS